MRVALRRGPFPYRQCAAALLLKTLRGYRRCGRFSRAGLGYAKEDDDNGR
jgi:hypothetical protein